MLHVSVAVGSRRGELIRVHRAMRQTIAPSHRCPGLLAPGKALEVAHNQLQSNLLCLISAAATCCVSRSSGRPAAVSFITSYNMLYSSADTAPLVRSLARMRLGSMLVNDPQNMRLGHVASQSAHQTIGSRHAPITKMVTGPAEKLCSAGWLSVASSRLVCPCPSWGAEPSAHPCYHFITRIPERWALACAPASGSAPTLRENDEPTHLAPLIGTAFH